MNLMYPSLSFSGDQDLNLKYLVSFQIPLNISHSLQLVCFHVVAMSPKSSQATVDHPTLDSTSSRTWNDVSFSPYPVIISNLPGWFCSCFKAKPFVLITIISWNNHWVVSSRSGCFKLSQIFSFFSVRRISSCFWSWTTFPLWPRPYRNLGSPQSSINTEAGAQGLGIFWTFLCTEV